MEKEDMYKVPSEQFYDGMIINAKSIVPETIARYKDIDTTEKDIFVATYPRSGTTWTLEIIYLLTCKGDRQQASQEKAPRSLFMDLTLPFMTSDPVTMAMERYGEERIIKTHLPARYLERQINDGKGKVVCVMRNPKDQLVSYYHFYRSNRGFGQFPGTWNEFFELFRNKGLMYGDWLECNRSYWEFKERKNVLFLVYEEMKQDIKATIKKLGVFLGKPCSDEIVDEIANLVDLQSMQTNSAVNAKDQEHIKKEIDFIRKGQVGSWKSVFTVEQSEYVDQLYGAEIERLQLPIIYE